MNGSLFVYKEVIKVTTMLSIQQLNYAFPSSRTPVFSGLSMDICEGEFVSVIGSSGCGKSTLFKIIAGLLKPSGGQVILKGQSSAASRLGHIAYMPQQDLLLPWRTVLDNCLLPWELRRETGKEEAVQRIRGLLNRFGLSELEMAYPPELSGGMKQRVAFLRTLVSGGNLMLLDEPFGALDALTKRGMHRWLLELWGGLDKTVLFITHDLEEALLLSDRIYLMNGGSQPGLQELVVKLPRPRSYRMNYDPQFIALREELERRLHESHHL
ncbi:ABC transporter ATP-binding protein [Paenibacillus albidus]|uniref:ABC transporter ATP-binding protein n=1 Tax=Paenibacillus albidus TaxID=2041023 RepID=UPI002035949C|nr:ABC transporter ATP-binding protein [Paenibacillus albidus]